MCQGKLIHCSKWFDEGSAHKSPRTNVKLMVNDNRNQLNAKTACVFKVRGVSQCSLGGKWKLGGEVTVREVVMTADIWNWICASKNQIKCIHYWIQMKNWEQINLTEAKKSNLLKTNYLHNRTTIALSPSSDLCSHMQRCGYTASFLLCTPDFLFAILAQTSYVGGLFSGAYPPIG